MINCKNCQKTSCAKQVVKQKTIVLFCSAYKARGEPVAWMDVDGNVSDNNDHNCFPIPLYTTANIQSYLEKDNGWTEAMERIIEKVKSMPWENDTKDSFLVWLKEQ